ncbi:MAG: 50S ribosomal protein L29 [Holosporales bacterium]|jgi:ribosomal protein L29|nr:50S ribosomal protein L29 [Holosporales bacterium]
MEFDDLKNNTVSELYRIIEERRKEQLNLRIRVCTMQDVKMSRFKEVRRDIARVLTRLQQLKSGDSHAS